MDNLYSMLKGRAYYIVTTATGRSNADAQASGFKDVYDLLMSDSDHPRQARFLTLLTDDVMPEGHPGFYLTVWQKNMRMSRAGRSM